MRRDPPPSARLTTTLNAQLTTAGEAGATEDGLSLQPVPGFRGQNPDALSDFGVLTRFLRHPGERMTP
ncbi:hypothetical protein ASPU41_10840 [Arthrobacter sp. U41]|nr:hypothetical protein ASPU41_10840 [Arthrobacter sp. U41]